MNIFLSVSLSVRLSVTLVHFCVPPVRFCVPPFAFIIYNPTMELGGVLVPTYRNHVVIFKVRRQKYPQITDTHSIQYRDYLWNNIITVHRQHLDKTQAKSFLHFIDSIITLHRQHLYSASSVQYWNNIFKICRQHHYSIHTHSLHYKCTQRW